MQSVLRLVLLCAGVLLALFLPPARADQVLMRDGETYRGTVLSLTASSLVFTNENLGRLTLPRAKVATIQFGGESAAAATTNAPAVPPVADVAAQLRGLRQQSNAVRQVQEQVIGSGSPEAVAKFHEMLEALGSGKMDLAGLRAEAQRAAEQIRSFQKELGPEVGEALEGYLTILDAFVKETEGETQKVETRKQAGEK
jgi:hypothetical protein